MSLLKSFVRLFPGGAALAERNSYNRRKRKLESIGDPEARFTAIFAGNKWKDSESVSGAGSSLKATEKIRVALPNLLDELNVETIFDAPCGDYHWFRHVDRGPVTQYIGGDIVKSLIQVNNASFEDDATHFVHMDITRDALPDADLWLCRDCLIHLSFDEIRSAIGNFLNSRIPYWLTTTHLGVDRNIDIPTGHCRMLNLELAPLNFPKPLRYIQDNDHESTDKQMALWSRGSLLAKFGENN